MGHSQDVDDSTAARLLGAIADPTVVVDAQARLRYANEAVAYQFGLPVEHWVGRSTVDLVHPDDLELVLTCMVTVQAKQIGSPIEVRVRTESGWRLCEVVGAPVPWFEEGAVVLSLHDLTERRRFEVASNEDARFRSLVQNSATVTMLVSRTGIVRSASGALTRLLGHDPEWIENLPLADIVAEEDRPALSAAFDRASVRATAANPATVAVRLIGDARHQPAPFELTLVNLFDDPTVGGFVVSARDVTRQDAAERELRGTLRLLTEAHRRTIALMSAAETLTTILRPAEVLEAGVRLAAELVSPPGTAGRAQYLRLHSEAVKVVAEYDEVGEPSPATFRIARHPHLEKAFRSGTATQCRRDLSGDGALIREPSEQRDLVDCVYVPVHRDGEVDGVLAVMTRGDSVPGELIDQCEAIGHLVELALSNAFAHDDLEALARTDALTGLANRREFEHLVTHRPARYAFALLAIDVDGLTQVNDRDGHPAGDALLVHVARTLAATMRRGDMLARLGGDEFGAVVFDADEHSARLVAERMLEELQRSPFNGAVPSVSIGIALGSPQADAGPVFEAADRAMYAAKDRGGGCYALSPTGEAEPFARAPG